MRLSLLHKSIIIIGINLLVTIGIALAARQFIQIPRYDALEHALDQRQYDQVHQALNFYERQLNNNIWTIAQLIAAMRPHISDLEWRLLVEKISLHPRFSTLDNVLVLDPSLPEPWVYTSDSAMPKAPRAGSRLLEGFLSYIEPRMLAQSNDSGVININGVPLLYAAASMGNGHIGQQAPTLVVIKALDIRFLIQIQSALGVEAELISQEEWAASVTERSDYLGNRESDGYSYTRLESPTGGYAAWMRFRTPPRLYEDPYFTYASFIPLAIMVLLWAMTVIAIYRRVIQPIKGITAHLSSIRESSDYSARLRYQAGDEIQSLAAECNDLISHVDEHTQSLQRESNTDALTGAYNRRYFDQQIASYWSMASRANRSLALAIFDIDHFKRVNDDFGHPVGDEVLKQFSAILQQTFRRSSDVVARIGGEEFAVLMFDVPSEDAVALCEAALAITRRRRLDVIPDEPPLSVTASAGLSLSSPVESERYTDFMNGADGLLYQAKTSGRDRLCCDCEAESAPISTERRLKPQLGSLAVESAVLSSKPCS